MYRGTNLERAYGGCNIHISITDLHWVAGFYEGEGSANFTRGLRVQVTQVQKWPLDRLGALFGGYFWYKGPKGRRSATWVWTITGPKAAGLLMTLFSLLSPKRRKQIQMALAAWRKARPSYGACVTAYRKGGHHARS